MKSTCYSYFAICSKGKIESNVGFVAAPSSNFDPDTITARLGIQPFDTSKLGMPRKNGDGYVPFSSWAACKQTEPMLDAETQCLKIVRQLSPKIDELRAMQKEYNVDYSIIIVPELVVDAKQPGIVFNREIIEFCYLTGTEIGLDLYVYFDK